VERSTWERTSACRGSWTSCSTRARCGLSYQYYDDKAFEGLRYYEAGFKAGKITPMYNQIRPKLTQDEADKISSIMNPINTYVEEMKTKFVMGDESLANWDDFVAKIKKMGDIDYVLKVYNSKKQYTIDKRSW